MEKDDDTGNAGAENGNGQDVLPSEGGEPEDITGAENDGDGESAPSGQREESGSAQESETAQETHAVTLPEYYAENVLSVQTLEYTPADEPEEIQPEESEEKQEEVREEQEKALAEEREEALPEEPKEKKQQAETVTIGGVTWQSAPAYDGDTEGTYLFTAALPDGYAPAEGVSLPRIMVTVRAERRRVMAAKAGARAAIVEGSVSAGWTLDTDGKVTIYSDAGPSGWRGAHTGQGVEEWWDRVISLEVKNGVTRLSYFTSCKNLKSVKLPETLEEIGEMAFQNCTSLVSIEIPASVTKIGGSAFGGCSSLESVKMLGATPPAFVKGQIMTVNGQFVATKFWDKTGGGSMSRWGRRTPIGRRGICPILTTMGRTSWERPLSPTTMRLTAAPPPRRLPCLWSGTRRWT